MGTWQEQYVKECQCCRTWNPPKRTFLLMKVIGMDVWYFCPVCDGH